MTTTTKPTIASKLLQWQKHFIPFLFGGGELLGVLLLRGFEILF